MSESEQVQGEEGLGARAEEFLVGLLQRMDIAAAVRVDETEDRVLLDIECDDVERVIGRRGQVVDALQHLVGKVASKGRPGGKLVIVDAGGYRARHEERLESLAERMANKAIEQGHVVPLNPMNARDRRIVHMRVAEIEGVSTESKGEGDERHVCIVPDAAADE